MTGSTRASRAYAVVLTLTVLSIVLLPIGIFNICNPSECIWAGFDLGASRLFRLEVFGAELAAMIYFARRHIGNTYVNLVTITILVVLIAAGFAFAWDSWHAHLGGRHICTGSPPGLL